MIELESRNFDTHEYLKSLREMRNTEYKRYFEEYEQKYSIDDFEAWSERQQEKEKMKANLLRSVSHDLRTPLTSISTAASLLSDEGEDIPPERRRAMLAEISDDAQWLIRMVENLLSITRVGGAADVRKTPEAAEEVISEAVRKYRARFDAPAASTALSRILLSRVIRSGASINERFAVLMLYSKLIPADRHTDSYLFSSKSRNLFFVLPNIEWHFISSYILSIYSLTAGSFASAFIAIR